MCVCIHMHVCVYTHTHMYISREQNCPPLIYFRPSPSPKLADRRKQANYGRPCASILPPTVATWGGRFLRRGGGHNAHEGWLLSSCGRRLAGGGRPGTARWGRGARWTAGPRLALPLGCLLRGGGQMPPNETSGRRLAVVHHKPPQ